MTTTLKKLDIAGARHQHAILDKFQDFQDIKDIEVLNISNPLTLGVKNRIQSIGIGFAGIEKESLKEKVLNNLEVVYTSKEMLANASYCYTFNSSIEESEQSSTVYFIQNNGEVFKAPYAIVEHDSAGAYSDFSEDNSGKFNEFIADNLSDNKYIIVQYCDYSQHYERNIKRAKRVVLN